jgi:hypothetical protein
MKDGDFAYQFARTMAVVQELAQGKHMKLPNGYEIAMGEDMSIGYVLRHEDGKETIGGLCTMDLSQLNGVLEKQGIGMIIPKIGR